MSLNADCPDCGKQYRVSEDKAGKRFRCKECGSAVTVPTSEVEDEWADGLDDDFGDMPLSPMPGGRKKKAASAAAAMPGKKSGGKAKSSKGKSGSAKGSSSKKGKKGKASESNNTMLIASIAAAVFVVGGLAFFLFSGGDDETTPAGDTVAVTDAPAEPKPGGANGGNQANGNTPAPGVLGKIADKVDTTYLPNGTAMAIVVNPSRIFESPLIKAIPQETIDAGLKESPIDARKITQVTIAMVPPKEMLDVLKFDMQNLNNPDGAAGNSPPLPDEKHMFVGIVHFSEPMDAMDVAKLVTGSLVKNPEYQEVTHEGKTFIDVTMEEADMFGIGGTPERVEGASVYMPTTTTAVIATSKTLKEIVIAGKVGSGSMASKLASRAGSTDILLTFSLADHPDLREFFKLVMEKNPPPPMMANFARLPEQLRSLSLSIDLSGNELLGIGLQGIDDQTTSELYELAENVKTTLTGLYAGVKGLAPTDTEEGKKMLAAADTLVESLTVTKNGDQVTFALNNPGGLESLVGEFGKAMESFQTGGSGLGAGNRGGGNLSDKNKLKQIGLAFHNYHDTHGTFPPMNLPGVLDEANRMKVSWRVHLLPFLEENALYEEFDIKADWNSPGNNELSAGLPEAYRTGDISPKSSNTHIRVFQGDRAVFSARGGMKIRDIIDGTSNTILAVIAGPEAGQTWTEPGGIPFNPENPRAGLGTIPASGLMVLMCDGAVITLPADISDKDLAALITRNGGEQVDLNQILSGN